MASSTQIKKLQSERGKQFYRVNRAVAKVFKDFGYNTQEELTKTLEEEEELFNSIDWIALDTALETTLRKNIKLVTGNISNFANDLFEYGLDEDSLVGINNAYMKMYNKDLAMKVTGITDVTKNQIKKVIQDGFEDGLKTNDIAKNISDKFTEISEGRARVIARTEVNSTVDNVHNKVAVEAGMDKKTWIHTGAGKTSRPEHVALDSKTIKMDGDFIVNGYKCKYPHDPVLPASENIGCHCLVVFE